MVWNVLFLSLLHQNAFRNLVLFETAEALTDVMKILCTLSLMIPRRTSVSVKEIFQRVTDAWSVIFVRQRENCESQWMTPPYFQFCSHTHCTPPPIPIKIIMPHWVIKWAYHLLRSASCTGCRGQSWCDGVNFVTARCTIVQSAVLRLHVVCLSVCLSVCL